MDKSEVVGKSACNLRSRMEDARGPSYYPVAYLTAASIIYLVVSEPESRMYLTDEADVSQVPVLRIH